MSIKELVKLSNGKELDIEYPIKLLDKDGNEVYFEDSNGDWYKHEYKDGKMVYFENSNGYIDDRREPVDMTMDEVCKLVGKKVRIVE